MSKISKALSGLVPGETMPSRLSWQCADSGETATGGGRRNKAAERMREFHRRLGPLPQYEH